MFSDSQLNDFFAWVPLSDQNGASAPDANSAVAHVPFDFVVGEILLPAGAYDLEQTEIPGMIALRRTGCSYPEALVQEIRSERDNPKLLFYRQENLYFLAQVLASSELSTSPNFG